ncbi:hypothetical protein ABZP36_003065 [Zizania latifolia]
MLVTFATEHRIHLVCDEIYAGSVFAKPETSGRDFGLPGFRVGIIYSYNDAVVACARRMSSFGLVSSQTQYFLARILSDEEFISRFLEESTRRLAARHERFTSGLREVGIGCLRANAGLFTWMDLRVRKHAFSVAIAGGFVRQKVAALERHLVSESDGVRSPAPARMR